MTTMKAAAMQSFGGPEKINISDLPVPAIGSGEMLVRMKSASINPIDWKTMLGKVKILIQYPFPLVPGSDGAGVVETIGPGVSRFKVGDRVYFRPGKDRIGTFSQYFVVRETEAAVFPSKLSFDEAASLPLAGLTSWQALDLASVKAGDQVLIHAGAGGVGALAVQLARARGAIVTATCSAKNADFVRSLGATTIIDYRTEDYTSGGKRFDFVFDTQGGKETNRCMDVLKPGGMVVSIANPPDPIEAVKFGRPWYVKLLLQLANIAPNRAARKRGVQYRALLMDASSSQLEEMGKLIERGSLNPVIDKIFSFSATRDAIAYQMLGHSRGKVIIHIED